MRMTPENIKVSVIVPMFNAAEYLQETIESLLAQTLRNIEIILVDDQSSDSTYQISSYLAEKYEHIVLHRQPENKGVSAARNVAMDMAKGQFIFFADADDTIPHDALEIMYKAAVEKNADLVTGVYKRVDSKSENLIAFFHQFPDLLKEGYKNIYDSPGLLYSVYCWGKLFKRSLVENIRFVEGISFAEDHVFTLEAFLHSNKIYNVDVTVYHYRVRDKESESVTQAIYKNPAENLRNLIRALSEIEKRFSAAIPDDNMRIQLFGVYFTRVMHWNIWTSLSNALLSLHISDRIQTMQLYIDWLKQLDKRIIKHNSRDFKIINDKIEKIMNIMDRQTISICRQILALV